MVEDRTLRVVAETKASASGETDGRRQRSERSRKQIIDAMFALIKEGHFQPGAALVAERASVGLRTVFRHFDDMDSLYREMMGEAEKEFLPGFMSQLTADGWRARLSELISNRTAMYEQISPLKTAAGIRRFQSQFLMDSHMRFRALERSGLLSVLPDDITADKTLFAAIDTAMSFDAWRSMRQDQSLSVEESRAVMARTVDALLPG